MTDVTSWSLRGDVMEACSCDTTCPCNFNSNPTRLPCEAVLSWHIREGSYGETRLDDLNLVLYVSISGYAFDGNWTGGVYLDERANPEQATALGTIFSGQAGGWPAVVATMFSKQFDPKQVPIRFEVVDGDGHVEVPGLVEAGSERVPNPMPDQPALDPQVNALAVPFYTGPMQVRRAKVLKLTDPNMTFEHSGSSSLVGSFEYAGP